jgi:hypothetical protein
MSLDAHAAADSGYLAKRRAAKNRDLSYHPAGGQAKRNVENSDGTHDESPEPQAGHRAARTSQEHDQI